MNSRPSEKPAKHRRPVKTHQPAPLFEALEDRRLLSTATLTQLVPSATRTVLGQNFTLTATVTPQGAGTPTGKVRFLDGTTLLGKSTVNGSGVATLSDYALFKGAHSITAKYLGDSTFGKSLSAAAALTIAKGKFNTTSDGLKIATIVSGTGPAAASGDDILLNYTGYLTDGTLFDSSLNPGRTPFDVILGQTSLIQGFTEGLMGMQAGETRVLLIPSALGYGPSGSSPTIPPNANLYFILQAISVRQTELGVTGANSTPIASGAAPSVAAGTDFGDVRVSTTSSPASIQLSAIGSIPPTTTRDPFIVLGGADPGDFTLGQDSGGTFTVTFSPTVGGRRTAKIRIFTTDSLHPTYIVKIAGNGV